MPLSSEQPNDVLSALGVGRENRADLPLHYAVTARVKSLVPMRDPDRLQALVADPVAVEAACRRIGSTGLYPYAVVAGAARRFEARQFPRASGYPRDAATGIAAAALVVGPLRDRAIAADDRPIRVYQGRAMGRLPEITVRLGFGGDRLPSGRSGRSSCGPGPSGHGGWTPMSDAVLSRLRAGGLTLASCPDPRPTSCRARPPTYASSLPAKRPCCAANRNILASSAATLRRR
ncbi:PhzF family phenazine biosynthesis protein [Methylobacterium sp. J-088]|uniref:PhzF family phenazine biosynthesis protein n=1 Tax=Methylobacterium sp. J-088 TaxID=2836664 RepID=UPI001FB97052|nr:PhzF family phenazine biosynthesis protein [Methylobacterium sp. J-088]MCJ2062728.1 PhzF family phenazine biosynthesis protein [Methylobacterium sp. J-088]